MMLLLHGEAGGWDELLIALVAFGVMWIAVKLAGRKPSEDADDESGPPDEPTLPVDAEQEDPAPAPAQKPT